MQSIDGNKGSGIKFKELIFKKKCKELKLRNSMITNMEKQKIENQIIHSLTCKTVLKYKILRIRSKISYSAYIERLTI